MDSQEWTLQIAARPTPLELSIDRTAVIVVDMQNDFASPGGMFHRAGIDVGGIQKIVDPMATLLEAARTAGMLVVYLKMGFRPDLADSGAPHSPTWLKHVPFGVGEVVLAPDGTPSRTLVRDTWSTDIVDGLKPHAEDLVVYKTRYSGFYNTGLDELLRDRGVDTLIVVGATTSVCVESTIRDATFRDYRCLVVEDCVAEPIGANESRTNHDASLRVLELLFAWITDSTGVTEALRMEPSRVTRAAG